MTLLFFPDIPVGHQLEEMPGFDLTAVIDGAYKRRVDSYPFMGVLPGGQREVIWRLPGAVREILFGNAFHPGERDGSL